MATLALIIATAFLAYGGWVAVKRRRVYSVLLMVLALYGLLFTLSVEEMWSYDSEATNRAAGIFLVGTVSLLSVMSFLEILFRRSFRIASNKWALAFSQTTHSHLAISSVFLLISLTLYWLGRGDFNATWEDARENANVFLVAAPLFMFLASPGVVSAWRVGLAPFILFLLAIGLIFSISGSRAAALSGVALYFWYWLSLRRKLDMRSALPLFALGAAALVVHALLRGVRSFSPAEFLDLIVEGRVLDIWEAISNASGGTGIAGSEATIVKYLVFSAMVADAEVYGWLTSVKRVLLMFVPGTLYTEKPVDVSYLLWADAFRSGMFDDSPYFPSLAAMYANGVMGSLHPTFFGELFLSGEWFGLIAGIFFFGSLFMLIDLALIRMSPFNAILLVGPAIVGMAMVARGNSVIGLGYFFYLVPVVFFTTYFLRGLRAIALPERVRS